MADRSEKVIIFGVGKYWNSVRSFLAEGPQIVAYMDNCVKDEKKRGGVKLYLPEEWQEVEFEKIIICIVNHKAKLEMMNQLLDLGIAKERIGFIEEYLKNYDVKITVEGKDTVNILANGITVRCTNEIEYMIAQEILAGEEYGFHTSGKYFVIDIGMNIGCTALYFASQKNVTSVYGFEPFKGVYDKAVSNISLNRKEIREKIQTYNVGLGKTDGIEKYIAHEGIYESAGIKKVQEGAVHSDCIIEQEMKQASGVLGGIMQAHEEHCLMKIDCEGAEYGILEDLINSGNIREVDTIIMEWHVGKYIQLENLLNQAGYAYVLNKNSRDFGMCYAWREKR